MEAAYNKKTAVVVLDASEVRLIMKALDELRYSDEMMNGSQLLNLAVLSHEWLCMTQDIGSPTADRITDAKNNDRVMSKIVEQIYGERASWEVS